MGLPLYIAPVESDIKRSPTPPKSPAYRRSAIRRFRASRTVHPNRRNLDYIAAYHSSEGRVADRATSPPLAADLGQHSPSRDTPDFASVPIEDSLRVLSSNAGRAHEYETGAYSRAREQLLSNMGDHSNLEHRIASFFNDRVAQIREQADLAANENNANPDTASTLDGSRSSASPQYESSAPAPRYSAWHDFVRPDFVPSSNVVPSRRSPRPPPQRRVMRLEHGPSYTGPTIDPARQLHRMRRRGQEARFDGLGDRNRSPSPGGDAVWDTLLSTLTPDPQPPSVGSSFASTTASQVASQSARGAGSSRTSITEPDPEDVAAADVPCDSVYESDTEYNEDDVEISNAEIVEATLRRFPSSRNRRPYGDASRGLYAYQQHRSYAEAAAEQAREGTTDDAAAAGNAAANDDALEGWDGGLDGLQRIVRSLADREDIPDEWWANAGVSRTLSREASGPGA